MPRNTIGAPPPYLQDASVQVELHDPQALAPADMPDIAICYMAPAAVAEYQLPIDDGPAGWELSPAAALTAGIGIYAAAFGAVLYGALG